MDLLTEAAESWQGLLMSDPSAYEALIQLDAFAAQLLLIVEHSTLTASARVAFGVPTMTSTFTRSPSFTVLPAKLHYSKLIIGQQYALYSMMIHRSRRNICILPVS